MKRLTYRTNTGGEQDIVLVDKKSVKKCLKWKKVLERLAHYEDLEEKERLFELPCAVGDFALFSSGDILPVVYITVSKNGITVGCQNGIHISDSSLQSWCRGFFKTREEAEEILKGDRTK